MTSSLKIGIVTSVMVGVALACLTVSLLSAGVGHGSYLPFAILFPYAFLSVEALGGDIGFIAGTLMFAQFLVYGVVLCRAWIGGRAPKGVTVIVVSHVVVATICTVLFYGN